MNIISPQESVEDGDTNEWCGLGSLALSQSQQVDIHSYIPGTVATRAMYVLLASQQLWAFYVLDRPSRPSMLCY